MQTSSANRASAASVAGGGRPPCHILGRSARGSVEQLDERGRQHARTTSEDLSSAESARVRFGHAR